MASGSGHLTPERSDTVHVILDAARRRYARFGASKTTMGDVAREARLSRTTLYTYFRTKDELYAELLDRETVWFVQRVEQQVDAVRGARQKLRRIVAATLEFYADNSVLLNAITSNEEMILEQVAHRVVRAHDERMEALLSQVLREGVAEGTLREINPERIAHLIWLLGSTLIVREVTGLAKDPFDQIVGAMDELFNRGIVAAKER